MLNVNNDVVVVCPHVMLHNDHYPARLQYAPAFLDDGVEVLDVVQGEKHRQALKGAVVPRDAIRVHLDVLERKAESSFCFITPPLWHIGPVDGHFVMERLADVEDLSSITNANVQQRKAVSF